MSPDKIRIRARCVREFLEPLVDRDFLSKLFLKRLNLKQDFAGRLLKDNTDEGVCRVSSLKAVWKNPRIKQQEQITKSNFIVKRQKDQIINLKSEM